VLTSDSFGHSGAQWAAPGLAGDAEHDALRDGTPETRGIRETRDTSETRGTCGMCGTGDACGICGICDACDIRDPERDEVRSGLVP
jgi:hypothetical protein